VRWPLTRDGSLRACPRPRASESKHRPSDEGEGGNQEEHAAQEKEPSSALSPHCDQPNDTEREPRQAQGEALGDAKHGAGRQEHSDGHCQRALMVLPGCCEHTHRERRPRSRAVTEFSFVTIAPAVDVA
jgi:hypothetical protein